MKPEIQMLITLAGFFITAYGFYNVMKVKAIEQATEVNTLKLKVEFLEKTTATHTRRLDDHDLQNKSLVALTEQMKSLTEDVKELKIMIKESR